MKQMVIHPNKQMTHGYYQGYLDELIYWPYGSGNLDRRTCKIIRMVIKLNDGSSTK